jgi:hypothetical protein
MTETARDKLSIPWSKIDVFNKYQAALDNQLFRTMKALRDAQSWRLDTLETETVPGVPDESEAA